MIGALIFDMDGVIIDSEPMHVDVDLVTSEYFGIAVTKEHFEEFVGMTNPEMWNILKQRYHLPQPVSEIIDYQLSLKINVLKAADMEPIDGIKELIHELREHNIPCAIASSSPRKFIEEVLLKFNMTHLFQRIVSGEEVAHGKPAPDVYIEAASQLGVDARSCVVLEDSKNGIAAAKAAGMKCIGYDNPNSGNQSLLEADIIVRSIRDIRVEEFLR
ncbi:HAD family hydrolase [Paenibacillus tarimensis]